MEPDDWTVHRKLVMRLLEMHGGYLDEIRRDVSEIKTSLALLEQDMRRRAAFAGSISGGVISIIVGAILLILQSLN